MTSSVFRRFAAILILVGAIAGAIAPASVAAEHDYVLQTAKTRTIKGIYKFEIDAPKMTAREWIVFAAQAPELPSQTGTRTKLMPGGETYRDLSDRHRSLLLARIPATSDALKHSVRGYIELQATLHSRKLVRREPGVKYAAPVALSDIERAAALAETTTLDFSNDKFQAWLKEHRLHQKRKEDDLDFGRRVFLSIKHSMGYEYTEKMDRHASHLCEVDHADCGGMSVLFVAVLRASRIPARVLAGRWAKSSKPDATLNGVSYYQQHIKAEFYARDVGWVPVDLSSAVVHDKTPEGLRYFGNDAGDFLTVHVDPDLKVDSPHFGVKSFPLLQSFHYFVDGAGKLDEVKFHREWTVETLP